MAGFDSYTDPGAGSDDSADLAGATKHLRIDELVREGFGEGWYIQAFGVRSRQI